MKAGIQYITDNNGEQLVLVPRAEFERLLDLAEDMEDIRALDEAMQADEESFPADFVHRLLTTNSAVRTWREYRGMSQAELAEAAGVRQATISGIERGAQPHLKTARALAKALGCDADDLF